MEHMPNVVSPGHLAYVEWYTAFTQPDPIHRLYKISRCLNAEGQPLESLFS